MLEYGDLSKLRTINSVRAFHKQFPCFLQRPLCDTEISARHGHDKIWCNNIEDIPQLIASFSEDMVTVNGDVGQRQAALGIPTHTQTVPLFSPMHSRRISIQNNA